MSGAAATVDARPRVRVVYYLDPVTGYTTQKRAPFDEHGGNIIGIAESGVFWDEVIAQETPYAVRQSLYAFLPWHRVLMVRDEPADSDVVLF